MLKEPDPAVVALEDTLHRCARGDRDALRQIYEAEAPRMLGVALRILRRRALAEEAVQDAFVQIWRNAAGFDPIRGSGRVWVYAILRNRSLNILRDEQRTDFAEDFDQRAECPTEEAGPEETVARLSEARALRQCLERLDPRPRRAVVLAYAHGLSHGELAGALGVPLGTVKSWLRRSHQILKVCLS